MTTGVVDLATGTGTVNGAFLYNLTGGGTVHVDVTSFAPTSPNTFTLVGRETDTVANGDKVFGMDRGTLTLTPTGINAAINDTIVGGTGRFANAFGINKITGQGKIVSIAGSVVTTTLTSTAVGWVGVCRRGCLGRTQETQRSRVR